MMLIQAADLYLARFSEIDPTARSFPKFLELFSKIIVRTDWHHKTYVFKRAEQLQPLLLAAKSLIETENLDKNLFFSLLDMIVLIPSPVVDEGFIKQTSRKLIDKFREGNPNKVALKLLIQLPKSVFADDDLKEIVTKAIEKNIRFSTDSVKIEAGRSGYINNNLWIAGIIDIFPKMNKDLLEKAFNIAIHSFDEIDGELEVYRIYYNLKRLEVSCPE